MTLSRLKLWRQALIYHAAAYRHGRSLAPVFDRTVHISSRSILAFVVLRNEAFRIPYFLKYYRNLGVDHFLFVDNDSNDNFLDLIEDQTDCSAWTTTESYKEANFGVHWANHLLRRYGSGHWCLVLDPDEFLIYPHMESRSLRELTEYLSQERKESFFAVMLDMYARGSIDQATYMPGHDPLETCRWFDPTGYFQERQTYYGDWWIRGGVRRRVFFSEEPNKSPALNKTVLIKWRRHYLFFASTHIAWPKRLNRPHFLDGLAPTGCLLHFKYLAHFRGKVIEEMTRKEHYAGSREYQRYLEGLNAEEELWGKYSTCFTGWRQCVNFGLMNEGRWF